MEASHRFQVVSQPPLHRKRGRPAGKNRVPLSRDEIRARNALYERERRATMTDAFEDLALAAGLDHDMSPVNLLAEVVNYLRKTSEKKNSWDVEALRRCNNNLAAQIADLEHRLATDPELEGCIAPSSPLEEAYNPHMKRKREERESQYPPSKRFAVDERVAAQYSRLQSHQPCDLSPFAGTETSMAKLVFDDEFSLPSHQLPCFEQVCQYQSAPLAVHQLEFKEEFSSPVSWEWLSPDSSSSQGTKETSCEELWQEILNASASSSPRFNDDGTSAWSVDDLFLNYFVG